uniref:Rab-GAP TBC domain-containing protein n=1 Tax=Strigamia maritima TaxID=126957 RepID=T1J5D5_STRMM
MIEEISIELMNLLNGFTILYCVMIEPELSVEVLRKRELKWLLMLEHWDKYMTKKYKKVRDRCRKGIPPAVRPRAWQFLCGGKYLMDQNVHKFEELEMQPGDPKWIDDIQKDLHRQFPFHEMFMSSQGHGQEDLFRILKAYSVLNPIDGYCQAQAPIAAILLMHMPAEQAFWCLVAICEKYLPGYYSQGLEAIQLDGAILNGLLKKVSPMIYKHLKKQKVEPILYMTEWFLCIYTRTLPWSSVLRVLDVFFCEGVKVMFRIALVILKYSLGKSERLKECPTLYETLEVLRNPPVEIMQHEFLIPESIRVGVSEYDMEREHKRQMAYSIQCVDDLLNVSTIVCRLDVEVEPSRRRN